MSPPKLRRGERYLEVTADIRALTELTIRGFIDKARPHFPTITIPYPEIYFAEIKSLGLEYKGSGIVLSAKHASHYKIGYLLETGAHEAAHWIVDCIWPDAKGHGPEFRKVCAFLGCEGKAKTSASDLLFQKVAAENGHDVYLLVGGVPRKKGRQHRHEWSCGCQSHVVKTRTHSQMLRRSYTCRKCENVLEYVKRLT